MTSASIIEKARLIVGGGENDAVGAQYVPDEAIEAEMALSVRELNRVAGTSAGRKEKRFNTTGGVQDYPISEVLGTDVLDIEEVARQSAYLADRTFDSLDQVDARGRIVTSVDGVIPSGLQGDVTDAIVGVFRANHVDQFSFEIAYPTSGNRSLRLYPTPAGTEVVVVFYTASGAGVDSLPDAAEPAAVYAAVVALLECQINRISVTNRQQQLVQVSDMDKAKIIRAMQDQRDRYQSKYQSAVRQLGGN